MHNSSTIPAGSASPPSLPHTPMNGMHSLTVLFRQSSQWLQIALSPECVKVTLSAVEDRRTHKAEVQWLPGDPKRSCMTQMRCRRQEMSVVSAHSWVAWRAAPGMGLQHMFQGKSREPNLDYRKARMPRQMPESLGTPKGAVMSSTRCLASVKKLCFGNAQLKTPERYQAARRTLRPHTARAMASRCGETPPGVCVLHIFIQAPRAIAQQRHSITSPSGC